MSLDEFESVIRVNLIGRSQSRQKAAAILRNGGRVINMSSVSGQMGLFGQAIIRRAKPQSSHSRKFQHASLRGRI